jgi:hypothetical protein
MVHDGGMFVIVVWTSSWTPTWNHWGVRAVVAQLLGNEGHSGAPKKGWWGGKLSENGCGSVVGANSHALSRVWQNGWRRPGKLLVG